MEFRTTVRKKTETVDLARQAGFDFDVVGRDFDNTLLRKLGVPLRTLQLSVEMPTADVSLSARNAMCVLASRIHRLPSIHFTDNDITAYIDAPPIEKWYCRFRTYATHHVVPEAFERTELTQWRADERRIHTYDGYKEDIYVADFKPVDAFPEQFPFDQYVVVRPEALGAAYVNEETSLVPELLSCLNTAGMKVVYLPRRSADHRYAEPYNSHQVHVPERALDGLQLAWHSDGVLTGSGTMAREAACMGRPAVSFFPGPLLSVDREMVDDGMLLHARDPDEILSYLQSTSDRPSESDLHRSKQVRDETVSIVRELIENPGEPKLPAESTLN